MTLSRILLAAASAAAFALPAAAQDQPATPQPAETAAPAAADQAAQPHAAPAAAEPATPPAAAATDLVVGTQVVGGDGQPVGTIESADATGAVVSTGNAKGRLNLDAFFKSETGLLIGYNRAEFEAAVTGMGGPETPDE